MGNGEPKREVFFLRQRRAWPSTYGLESAEPEGSAPQSYGERSHP